MTDGISLFYCYYYAVGEQQHSGAGALTACVCVGLRDKRISSMDGY